MSKKIEELQKELEDLEESINVGEYRAFSPQGKPIMPNQVRNDIRKYLQESGTTQTKFLSDIGINSNSFGKFMNGTYKDPLSACQNGTYEAACAFFAKKKLQDKINELTNKAADKASGKRTVDELLHFNPDVLPSSGRHYVAKKSRNVVDAELSAILTVPLPEPCPVYANCDEVREMIAHFLATSGITQSRWLKAIDVASNSLSRFLKMSGKGVGAGNSVYLIAWKFFERKRLLDDLPKSDRRLEQEARWGSAGFPLRHDDGHRYTLGGVQPDPRIYDIEWCQDIHNEKTANNVHSSSGSGGAVHHNSSSSSRPVNHTTHNNHNNHSSHSNNNSHNNNGVSHILGGGDGGESLSDIVIVAASDNHHI